MADLVVVVPSRGRPAAAHELAAAFLDTCTASTQLLFALDDRDADSLDDYPQTLFAQTVIGPSTTMVEALNQEAGLLAGHPAAPFAIGFMGDDHRPRTRGWDERYLEALAALGTGMVYGNDLLQGDRIPTQIAMTSDIVRALGWMAPPDLTHLYVDNAWLGLGHNAQCITYLPDVIVEHLHPAGGKAEWDEGYTRVNSSSMYAKDEAAFLGFVERGDYAAAVKTVRALRGAA